MSEITVNLKMFSATIDKISVLMDPHEMKMNHNFSLGNQLELGFQRHPPPHCLGYVPSLDNF